MTTMRIEGTTHHTAAVNGIWLRHFFKTWPYDPEMMSDEEIAVYTKAYMQPGATRGACSDYRAAPEDVAQDTADADQLIDCPTLALWGADFAAVPGIFDVCEIWKGMARDIRCVEIPQCGRLPQEERPERVNQELLAFLDGWAG